MNDPRFPRRHLTERNRIPEGGWMPPLVVVTVALWAVGAAVMFWRMM